jgi:hypothetical protein
VVIEVQLEPIFLPTFKQVRTDPEGDDLKVFPHGGRRNLTSQHNVLMVGAATVINERLNHNR